MKLHFYILLLVTSEIGFSQPTINNDLAHRRYWFYRARFINDFMKIGDQQGDCICFAERNYSPHNVAKIGPDQIDITNQYLSALALEYKILKRANQSTKETIKEIYYLLKTINRLDSRADWFWPPGPAPANDNMNVYPQNAFLNGFMLREDMPKMYLNQIQNPDNFKNFNYALKEYNFNPANIQCGYSGIDRIDGLSDDNKFSNFIGFPGNSTNGQPLADLSLVHDKYYSMFVAFMFIIKYIPDGTGYYDENNQLQYFQDGEWDIKTEVRKITNRCHPYIRGNIFGNQASNWILEYPTGTNLSVGSAMFPFSYPMVQMICDINSSFPWPGYLNCFGYHDAVSNVSSSSYVFQTLSTGLTEDNSVFLANCQAGSNLPIGITPIWIAMAINTSARGLEWADLLRKVLHQDGGIMKQKSVYANPISQAPCIGPFNFGNCDSPCEWSSPDRLEHPKRRGQGCVNTINCLGYAGWNNGLDFAGNYPGVDYMLLHNLYYEYLNQLDDAGDAQSAKYKTAYNLLDNQDNATWPFKIGGFVFGVNSTPPYGTPMYVKVFQNLTSHSQIYATSSPFAPNNNVPSFVEYRAGKDITLLPEDPINGLPGFSAKVGSDFHAYIQRYICGQSDYANGMRQGNTGEQVYSNDYETDTMNTEVPIHFVEYTELSDADKYPVVNANTTNLQGVIQGQELTDASEEAIIQQLNYQNGIDNNSFDNVKRFEVLPNPSTGIFKVTTNKIDQNEILSITIVDMKGIIVYSNPDFKTNEFDLSQYAKGIYMLQMSSSLGKKYSKRLNLIE